jgi:hypothetical protein
MVEVDTHDQLRNACHGFIGTDLLDNDDNVIGVCVRTKLTRTRVTAVYRFNEAGVKLHEELFPGENRTGVNLPVLGLRRKRK